MVQPILNGIVLKVLSNTPLRKKNTARIKIPEKIGTVKQKMGIDSRQWKLTGVFTGSTKTSDRDNLQSNHDDDDTVTFVDEESNSFNVKILNFTAPPTPFGTRINFDMLLEEV